MPQCSHRVPAVARMHFFASAAAALAAGFVPCERCNPLHIPRLPDWRIGSRLVVRALRAIERGDLQTGSLAQLARRLDVSPTDLARQFDAELGVSPRVFAQTHRQHIQTQLRASDGEQMLQLVLPVREPFDASWVFAFLDKRSLPGLEEVSGFCYRRRLGKHWVRVCYAPQKAQLHIELPRGLRGQSQWLLRRIAHVFDIHADSRVIDEALKKEPRLNASVTGGIRVPGAWDGFETAVRAILGQQVSVARARRLAIDLMQRFGSKGFPTPLELVEADVSAVGMPGLRGEAVRQLARAVLGGAVQLDETANPETQFDTLCSLPGIGPWTAGYVAMRTAGDANAFPRADWVVLKQLGMTAGAAQRYSLVWEPFRAYALMYLWQDSQGQG